LFFFLKVTFEWLITGLISILKMKISIGKIKKTNSISASFQTIENSLKK